MSIETDSRIGKKWTEKEDNQLIKEINDSKNYEEIALKHKRTVLAIKLRVINNIISPKINLNSDEINIEDISKEYNIDIDMLKLNLNKISNKKDKNIYQTIIDNLLIINEKLDNINEKLDNINININKKHND